jgi:hypothetical protein
VRTCDHRSVDPDARVCPYCGEPPGAGVFCAACGRNLSDVGQLPTRRAWERGAGEEPAAPRPPAGGAAEEPAVHAPPAGGAAEAPAPRAGGAHGVAAFLAAMHAAGDPGATKTRRAEPGFLGRAQHVTGWVVRAAAPGEPGLFLTVDGSLRRLDSVTRGVDFRGTLHIDVVGPESAHPPSAAELAAVLRANGVHDSGL